ncbi:MAG TPA: hypothetical protein VFZ53_19455 [Polyangiaceae bacterium]
MRRATLLALLLLSCKKDPPHPADCPSGPDFEVLITALDARVPSDVIVSIQYGGGEDEYRIPDHGKHSALFCTPSDREGNPLQAGGVGGERPVERGPGGFGGAGPGAGLEALACELWTDSPATLTVETTMYPTATEELSAKKGKCVVFREIVLSLDDGGT